MLRGIGRMNLFYDANDYERFLTTLQRYVLNTGVLIHAHCLMSNHVHLLLKATPDQMALFCKKIEVSYARYFQQRYDHVGHLFQNRYRSETITSDRHYLAAVRYILHNPEPAGLGNWRSYPWSSAAAYLRGQSDLLSEVSMAMELTGSWQDLMTLLSQNDDVRLCEWDDRPCGLTDEDILEMIRRATDITSPLAIQQLPKKERDRVLRNLKENGATIRHIERVTGINRNLVQRA